MIFNLSRWLFIVELAVLLAPLTLVTLFWGPIFIVTDLTSESVEIPAMIVVFCFGMIGLIGLWVLSIRYLIGGTAGAASTRKIWWLACAIGVLTTLASTIYAFVLGPHGYKPHDPYGGIAFGIVGIPAVVPLAHILLCKFIAEKANNSFKPTPLRGAA